MQGYLRKSVADPGLIRRVGVGGLGAVLAIQRGWRQLPLCALPAMGGLAGFIGVCCWYYYWRAPAGTSLALIPSWYRVIRFCPHLDVVGA